VRARIFFDDCVLLHSNPNIDFRNISMACLQRCAVVLDILTVVVTSAQEMKGCEGPPFKKFHSPPSSLPRKSTSPLATSHPTEQRLLNDQCSQQRRGGGGGRAAGGAPPGGGGW